MADCEQRGHRFGSSGAACSECGISRSDVVAIEQASMLARIDANLESIDNMLREILEALNRRRK